jgi:hypothetical protein
VTNKLNFDVYLKAGMKLAVVETVDKWWISNKLVKNILHATLKTAIFFFFSKT